MANCISWVPMLTLLDLGMNWTYKRALRMKLIWLKLLYNAVLVSAVLPSESATRIHISLYPLPLASPSHPPYPTPLGGHKAPSWSPCAMWLLPTSRNVSILHLVVSICPCHSLTSSQLTLPPPRALNSILYVCIFIPVLPLGSSEPFFLFRFHIYVLAYGICFPLSDLTSLCMTDSRSTHLTTNNSILFLFMAE